MPSLADLIGTSKGGGVDLLQAKVVSVGAGNAAIHFGDPAQAVSGIRYLASASLSAGDSVWVLRTGNVLIIVGKLSSSTYGNPEFREGVELYHPSSTPYIDFHRAASPAGDANADYDIRIINNADNWLDIIGGNVLINKARIGEGDFYGDFAAFSHKDRWAAGQYALLQAQSGETYLNAYNTPLNLRINNVNSLVINADRSLHGARGNDMTLSEVRGDNVLADDGAATGNPNYVIMAGTLVGNFVGGNCHFNFGYAFPRGLNSVVVSEGGGASGWMAGTTNYSRTGFGCYLIRHDGVAAGGLFRINYIAMGY